MELLLSFLVGLVALLQNVVADSRHSNIWRSLSERELESVSKFLSARLNATLYNPEAGSRVNTILEIELLHPNKSDVLPWLSGEYATEPKRYARATVSFGIVEEPYHQEYMVGPLPASNITKLQPLTYPFNNQRPGKTRIASSLTLPGQDVQGGILKLGEDIADITRELWNTSIGEGGVNLRTQFPLLPDGSAWIEFIGVPSGEFDSSTVLPLGVSLRLDANDRNIGRWAVTGWFCMGKFYKTTEEFRAAIFTTGFEKPPPNVDGPWAALDKQATSLPSDDPPSSNPSPAGSKRFKIDAEESHVSWMDFSFFMSTSKSTGLSLFDINYKGKRLIYELGLQEALAQYAGSNPFQSQTNFFDSLGGMGAAMVPLVRGYDCPSYATYLNSTIAVGGQSITTPDAICLFEFDPGYPIRRHFNAEKRYTSAAKNIVFTVRTISTVGNYDYLIEYDFFLDGSIEVYVRASGYISAAYYAGNEDYGFHIHDFLSGAMHDHVITFKADLDILGEANSVQKVEFVPDTIEYPWAAGKPRNTFRAAKSFIASEDEASVNWAPNDAAIYAIVNKDKPNKYGEYPGYRIRRAAHTSHLTALNSSNTGNAAHYATHDLYITKQKDTEPRAADQYNGYDIEEPLVDFSKFLDGESLNQEDLVVWFNLGMHHIPHTGDLPNTLMTSAHSAIRLEPLNYMDGDPSVAMSEQTRVFLDTEE